jgi:antitoxin (DNA-binding transcriptional repressor) of toxin-antitoxin stability system
VNIGTKELKNRLSHYLRLVRAGESVTVCDRGKAVAELRCAPAGASDDEDAVLRELSNQGVISPGRRRVTDFVPIVVRGRKRVSRLVIEDR